jgi:hypothetical protein
MHFAYALVHSSPAEVVFAEDLETLSQILAREFIAQTPSAEFDQGELIKIRRALLDRRWGDAMALWIQHTGVPVDVFESADVRTDPPLDPGSFHLAIQMTPLFEEPDAPDPNTRK